MEGDFIKIREALLPLSWIYGCGVRLRNFCFDIGLLKSRAFHVPIIAVGNITVGGTGKTPHVEYLVRLLKDKFRVAVLSRGYKRKTRGFLQADDKSTVNDIGDEPLQMKRKFPDICVAVDKKRVHGIQQLTDNDKSLDVILLDDAFQHRYVKPGVNILLVDYHRLIIYDRLLPAGRLREPLNGKDRADIVVVTKCPHDLKPMEFRVITKAMNLFPYQHLFFTTLKYSSLTPMFPETEALKDATPQTAMADKNVLLLTGIASPQQMMQDLSPNAASVTPLSFADHHTFKKKDVDRINNAFAALSAPRIIITTEKDAARLYETQGLSCDVKAAIYTIPVEISFMQNEQEEKFCNVIVGYVLKNSRNSILAKGIEEQKTENKEIKADKPKTISFK